MDKEKTKKQIKLIIADVDGTLTDGGVYLTENGDEFKKFNAKDGMGFKLLIQAGYQVGIISASHSKKMVIKRAEMLGVQLYYIGAEPKTAVMEQWREELQLGYDEIAFIGDDVNDLEIMKRVGFSACPADAVEAIRKTATVTLERRGGDACFRELADRFFL